MSYHHYSPPINPLSDALTDAFEQGHYISPEMPAAFDADGRPIPVTEPVYDPGATADPEPIRLDVEQFIIALVTAAPTLEDIGERVLITAYLMHLDGAPENLRDLGGRLGCSHTMARRRVSTFCAHFREELGELVSRPSLYE
jgi:hypothetical protein